MEKHFSGCRQKAVIHAVLI